MAHKNHTTKRSVDRKLLLCLLTENELTLSEIGKRLGCSGERVRQLGQELLGSTGWQRQRERRDRKLRAVFAKNPFVQAGKRLGLKVEPAKRENPYSWYKRKLYVNGKSCLLRRATESVGYRGLYMRLRKQLEEAEICVLELAIGDFLIMSTNKMPRSPTMFSLYDPVSSKKTYVLPRPWRKYLNNVCIPEEEPVVESRNSTRGAHSTKCPRISLT
jgi:hypothetical protein